MKKDTNKISTVIQTHTIKINLLKNQILPKPNSKSTKNQIELADEMETENQIKWVYQNQKTPTGHCQQSKHQTKQK